MNKRFLLVIVPVVLVVIVLLIGSSPYAWIASKELAAGSQGPSAVQQDVIRAYYKALDTCDVKAFERLSIRGLMTTLSGHSADCGRMRAFSGQNYSVSVVHIPKMKAMLTSAVRSII